MFVSIRKYFALDWFPFIATKSTYAGQELPALSVLYLLMVTSYMNIMLNIISIWETTYVFTRLVTLVFGMMQYGVRTGYTVTVTSVASVPHFGHV